MSDSEKKPPKPPKPPKKPKKTGRVEKFLLPPNDKRS